MLRLRHYAAGATLGFALMFGGCAAPQGPVIPSSATLMSQGNNGAVTWRATESGRAYIRDDFNGVTLYSTELNRGEMIEVNPVDDEIRVNGRTASEYAMDDHHHYQIYFEPVRGARTVTYRETVEERRPDPVIERRTEIRTEPADRTVERKTVEIRRDDGTIERRTTVEEVDPVGPRPDPPLIDPYK
jgi:hypothetical protein